MNESERSNMTLTIKEKEYIFFFLYMKLKSNIFILTCGFFISPIVKLS